MLDSDLVCRKYADQDLTIFWGAYLGTADELLVSGSSPTSWTRSPGCGPRRGSGRGG